VSNNTRGGWYQYDASAQQKNEANRKGILALSQGLCKIDDLIDQAEKFERWLVTTKEEVSDLPYSFPTGSEPKVSLVKLRCEMARAQWQLSEKLEERVSKEKVKS